MTTPSELPVHLRFRRYECKYLLTEEQALRVRRYAAPYVEPDPFAARSPDGRYQISSLYLDSPDLRLFHETLGGIKDRFKLRIRAYTDRFDDPVFFEVKRRSDRVILKDRSRVRRADVQQTIDGGCSRRDRLSLPELASLEAFQARARKIRAQPQVLVRYTREAYQGVFDPTARLTFDRGMRARRQLRAWQFFAGDDWQSVAGGRVLLELKFNDQCPSWMSHIVRAEALRRISFSKYALSVSATDRTGALEA